MNYGLSAKVADLRNEVRIFQRDLIIRSIRQAMVEGPLLNGYTTSGAAFMIYKAASFPLHFRSLGQRRFRDYLILLAKEDRIERVIASRGRRGRTSLIRPKS